MHLVAAAFLVVTFIVGEGRRPSTGDKYHSLATLYVVLYLITRTGGIDFCTRFVSCTRIASSL